MVNADEEIKSTEHFNTTGNTELIPRLPFMGIWVHSSSPLNIDVNDLITINLPPLEWINSNVKPFSTIVQNTGYTVNVDVEYLGSRPSLSGSALRCPYELWCYHFHWGTQNDNGSEHRIMQQGFPMEIHLLFYNICYKSTEEAMKAKDGLLVLVYMCMLVSDDNKTLNIITNKIKKINQPGQSVEINSFPLSDLFDNNFQKYLMYWGSKENDPSNPALWLISSKPVHISEKQLLYFRVLKDPVTGKLISNCRMPQPVKRYKVFNVNQTMCTVKSLFKNVKEGSLNLEYEKVFNQSVNSILQEQNDRQKNIGCSIKTCDAKKTVEIYSTRIEPVVTITQFNTQKDLLGTTEHSIIQLETKTNKLKNEIVETNNAIIQIEQEDNCEHAVKDSRIKTFNNLMTDLNVVTNAVPRLDEPTKHTKKNITSSEVECRRNIEEKKAKRIITTADLNYPNQEECNSKVIKYLPTNTRREGIRMNEAALKRELFIKNKLKLLER